MVRPLCVMQPGDVNAECTISLNEFRLLIASTVSEKFGPEYDAFCSCER